MNLIKFMSHLKVKLRKMKKFEYVIMNVFLFLYSLHVWVHLDFEETVCWALSGVKNVFLHLWEEKSSNLWAVQHLELFFDYTFLIEDGNYSMLAGFSEVKSRDKESSVWMHSQGGRSKSSWELVEYTGVINSWGVANDSKNSVHASLSNIDHILIVRKSNSAWMSQLSINDWLQHADT